MKHPLQAVKAEIQVKGGLKIACRIDLKLNCLVFEVGFACKCGPFPSAVQCPFKIADGKGAVVIAIDFDVDGLGVEMGRPFVLQVGFDPKVTECAVQRVIKEAASELHGSASIDGDVVGMNGKPWGDDDLFYADV